MQLINRTILITGGTSGIGRALIEQLAVNNRKIIVIGRDAKKLAILQQEYPNLTPYLCEMDQPNQLGHCLGLISHKHPDINLIINNAAIQYNKKLTDKDFDVDSIQAEINTNLLAPIKICAHFLPALLDAKTESAIVNISSGLALFPKVSSAVYSATKAGLHNFSQSLGYQLENTRVKILEVILPLVDTPMTAGRGHGKLSADAAARQIIRGIQANRNPIYPGKSRWIPIISRLSPALMARIMRANS
jgi:uncharacterized oxidoreductase